MRKYNVLYICNYLWDDEKEQEDFCFICATKKLLVDDCSDFEIYSKSGWFGETKCNKCGRHIKDTLSI